MAIFKKLLSGTLVALMTAQSAVPIFANQPEFLRRNDGALIMTDSNGNSVVVDKSWEETYPSGTFAFNTTQVNLTENGSGDSDTGSLILYRLGGSSGRAIAKVTLIPTVSYLDDERVSYAYAAGSNDYLVEVENPHPSALTDPLGGSPVVYENGAVLLTRILTAAENLERGIDENTEFCFYLEDEPDAVDFQWQIRLEEGGKWTDIVGANDKDLPAFSEILEGLYDHYDVRCLYTVDGVRYCSESHWGETYVQPSVYEMDGWEELAEYYSSLDGTEEFSPILFEGNEYDNYSFYVVFAEGEDEKEIRFTALDDSNHEAREVVNILIEEAYGATLYNSANVATAAIADDEPELPSAMGFETREIWADMSMGSVRIPLIRTVEDPAALVYVTGADYTVEAGSALPGRNYAATEDGTILFPSDLDYSALEIPLINDGEILSREESDLSFTVRLTKAKGGGSSTLIPGYDEITVRLYNSGEGNASNIASRMYSADEIDGTLQVEESVSLVAPAAGIVAEAEEKPADVTADYIPVVDGNMSRVIDYGKLSFSGVENNSAYWNDKLLLANVDNVFSTADTDRHEKLTWEGGQAYGDGWEIVCKKNGTSAFAEIPDMYKRFTSLEFYMKGYAEKYMADYHVLGYRFNKDGTVYSLKNPGQSLGSSHYKNIETSYKYTIGSSDTGIGLNARYENTALIKYNADAWIELRGLYLNRRTINVPVVKIYTADDDLIYKNGNVLNQDLFNSLKPEISMAAGKGGVTTVGNEKKLYAGSLLNLKRGQNASSYSFASTANGPLDGAVSLYTGSGTKLKVGQTGSSGDVSLELLFDTNYQNSDLELRIYMDRSQTVTLDVSPSVPRVVDQDNNVTSAIDAGRISETWTELKGKNNGTINYSGKELNTGSFIFQSKNSSLNLADFSAASGSAQYKSAKVKNLQTINFGLPEEDIILFNGKAYKGNETITIPVSMLLNDNLTFYYYDEDYLNMENVMSTTIARVERYLDLNDNGVVDGEYNPDNGVFTAEGDLAMESITDVSSFPISSLAPQLYNGEYHQTILKVYYTMLPRCMTVPSNHSIDDTAEVVPAIVTNVTQAAARGKMTAEQLGYRYIDHGTTGNGKKMFGAAASAVSYVDIPLGGDMNPPYVENNKEVWNPDWYGNPYPGTEFTDPQPITLNGTALGDNYSVGETDENGVLTADGIKNVSAYLSAMQENDRFALCVRETVKPKARGTDEPVHTLEGIESSTLSDFYTYPSTTGVRNLSDPYAEKGKNDAGFDMSKSDNPMSEYNMNGEINMPELELSLTDYVTISTNGQELSISVGANLIGFKSESGTNNHLKPQKPEMNSVVEEGKEGIEKVKNLYNTLFTHGANSKDGVGQAVKDEFENLKKAGQDGNKKMPGIKSLGFEGNIAFNISLVLKWNPLENNFFFYQLMVMFAGELQFSFSVKLTPCPIFYVSITVGIGVELATGLERQRIKVRGETVNLTDSDNSTNKAVGGWTYYTNQFHMGQQALDEPENIDFMVGTPGAQITYKTNAKAIDVVFAGSMYVDAKDADGNRPEGFSPGVISSAGDEAVTVKLAKIVNGTNDKEYTVTFTAVDDGKDRYYEADGSMTELEKGHVIFDTITTIAKQTDDIYFAGFQLSPELFMEVAVGIGVELFNIELFINITIGASFGFVNHDSPEYAQDGGTTEGAVVNEFSFVAGVGLRVTALFFNFEFNAVQFAITYDRNATYDEDTAAKSGWNFIWYAANQPVHSYRSAEAADPLKVRIILPGALAGKEKLFSPEENAGMSLSRAFDPSDTDVPFQYSGYGSSGDAFTLGKDLLPGSTYELVTAGENNYVVYTVTNPEADSINATSLVLSRVKEVAVYDESGTEVIDTTLGLVNPADDAAAVKYLPLDNDNCGDLDFSVWADGDVIRAAWVSYTADAKTAYENAAGDAIDAMQAASVHTVVKTASFDTASGTMTEAEQVSPTVIPEGQTRGIYTSPSGAGDMIFYSEAIPYTADELSALLTDYEQVIGYSNMAVDSSTVGGETVYHGSSDPTLAFQMQQKKMQAAVYGKSFYPSFAYKTADGTYTNAQVKSEDWIKDSVNLENAALTMIGDDYYAAYTTAQTILTDTTEEVIRKLYLQKVTVSTEEKTVEVETPSDEGTEGSGEEGSGEGEDTPETETIVVTNITPDTAVAVRKLLDNRTDNSRDGVYIGGTLSEENKYKDPYFANVKFLNGKLGNLNSKEENFDDVIQVNPRMRSGADAEEFLLFDMNGNTYIIPKADILSITGSEHKGGIIPFFTRRTAEEITATDSKGELIASNVTIGADGNGNISAVYTASVENTSNTALYLTKYDPQSNTWGAGTMLAMHHMQIHEDAVREGWSSEDTQKAYFAPKNGDIYNFTFGRTAVASGSEGKLLVLAEGSKVLLEEQDKYTPVYNTDGTLKELKPDGTTYLPKTDSATGAYAISNGIYALSFGAGTSSLGYASLHLSNYDFTPGSEMYASVSFANMGDTAIRASEDNPATIDLMSDGSNVPLQTWHVKENIRAGQSVSTTAEYVVLPAGLEAGDKLYFRVYEDKAYIGENAFDQHTMTGDGEEDTAACITVEKRVELGYEDAGLDKSLITMVSADEDTVTLQADIHVGNRGSLDSYRTYLKAEYEDMQGDELVISPVNLENHRLSVSEQQALTRTVTDKTLRNGYLLLATTENGAAVKSDDTGSIDSMHGRTVTGTFTVPKDYFDTDYGTHSLNLRLTLEGYDENGNLYEEYDVSNNITYVSVEQKTFYETANNLNIQVGSYLRIPMTMQTSREAKPSVTVTEITDDNERNLSMLYYDAVQGAIIIMPSEEGEGKIRVADANTNSIYDICYKVIGEGLEINIFDDNGIFTWLDANANDGEQGHNAWDFDKNILRWSNGNASAPLRNDIAEADAGEGFTFRTLAESIDLYFMGEGDSTAKIQVSSTFGDYRTTTYTSADGSKAVRIDFGNSKAQVHTVTVKAVDGIVRFDKMVENFPADFEVKTDPAAPNMFYNRTLPKQASMDEDDEGITLGVFFLDMGGLTSVTMDDTDITSLLTRVNDSNELWYHEFDVTENTGHNFVITDQSGNTTTRTLSIDWFSTMVKEEDPGAEDIRMIIVDENGEEVTGVMDGDKNYRLKVTDSEGNPVAGAKVSSIPFGSTEEIYNFTPLGTTDEDGFYPLAGSAVYRVEYTPEGKSVSSIRMLCVDMGSTSYPSPLLKYDSSTRKLEYSVIVRDTSTTGKLTISSPIVSVKLDGKELLAAGQKVTYFEGAVSYEASGTYTLTAVNENGKEAVAVLEIPEMPIEFIGEVLGFKMVTEAEDGTDNDDGKLTVCEDRIIGGVRDGDSKRADYEYALVPSGEAPAEWQDDTEFTGLPVGDYDLHIRDANDPENVLVVGVTIGYESVRIDDIHSEPTSLAYHSGSIAVNAQGGYSELEYSYVPAGAEISDNGTPGDDSDDEVIYAGVAYPLWTSRSVMNDLPEGIYTVNVRETENHDNSISRQILVPHVVTIEEVRTVPVQNAENNGQIIVIATGGYGALEYSYVPDGAEISDNGTPYDDSDDMVLYKGAEYPLWMPESQMNTLPVGLYTVQVRDERLTTVRMTDVDVPDHMVIRVETVPTYEDESTGSIEVLALGGYGSFEYCYLPLAEDGTLRSDVVIGSTEDEGDIYQTIMFNGREEAPLWTIEYNFTDLPKGRYMIIVRDTMDPMNSEKVYPDAEELLKMTENQYTAVAFAEIRNHDKFEITVTGDIGTDLSPEGVTLVQRHRGLTVTILPKSGFQLERILIDGRMMSNVYGSYTFENVNEPHTVQVFSKQLETIPDRLFPLYVSSTEGGSVSYEGRLIAAYGSSRKLEITADEGWRIADVLVDGESVGAVSSYEFRAVIDEHSLHAVFEKIEDDVNP